MPWLKRKRRWYYYIREYVNGKWRFRYIGRGVQASLMYGYEVIEMERKLQERDFRRACVEIDRQSRRLIQLKELLFSSYLELYGFHNPRYRGLRRARKMVDFADKSKPDSDKPDSATLNQTIVECQKGDSEATKKIQAWVKQYPELFIDRSPKSLSFHVDWFLVRKMYPNRFEQEMLLARSEELRQSLTAEGTGTVLESLAIDLVISTQLAYNLWSFVTTPQIENPKTLEIGVKATGYFADKHRRAIESLAKVRQIIQNSKPPSKAPSPQTPLQPIKAEDAGIMKEQAPEAKRGRKKKYEVELCV
jgi:hypothetical protein